jgi:cobalt transporter subunit CbtA
MIGRVLLAAILAGLAAGLLMGVIQHVRLTPLILEAEVFEHVAHGHSGEAHSHGDQVWSPAKGFERTFYSTLTAVLTAIGFALLMAGISFIANIPITTRNGFIWGVCGFLAVSLAPAIEMPPELPGMAGTDLVGRQFRWIGTIVFTAMGLYGLYAWQAYKRIASAAVILLVMPHVLYSAPKTIPEETQVPAHLAAQFATASLGANLVMWVVIGVALGYALQKFESVFKS